jgi:hypothetical protein
METMGDLLEKVKEFATKDFSRDAAEKLFGWKITEMAVRNPDEDKSSITMAFENGLVLNAFYFLHPALAELGDNVEFTLRLKTDLKSRIRYNIFYSGYIHGQGYMRIDLGTVENKMVQSMYEEYYIPALRRIFRPVIEQFRGFCSRDYFGVTADQNQGYIYYSPVSSRSECRDASIWDVIAKLHRLDDILRDNEIRHGLAELDLQMSFLPSVMWT